MARKLLSQTITTNGDWYPIKCALHIEVSGQASPALTDQNGYIVWDATNTGSVSNNTIQTYFDDQTADFTDSGCMTSTGISTVSSDALGAQLSYPIQMSTDGQNFLYLRVKGNGSITISIDGKRVSQIALANSSWYWVSTPIILPDNLQHTLTVNMLSPSLSVDKLYLSKLSDTPTGYGLNSSTPSWVTLHVRVATCLANQPNIYVRTNASLNTYADILDDGWYNFDTSTLVGYSAQSSNQYCVVVATSGSSSDHYLIWDVADQYAEPSAMFANNVWTVDNTTSMALRVYENLATQDEYGVIVTPDATLETIDYMSRTCRITLLLLWTYPKN
jgi:hypothetical protein